MWFPIVPTTLYRCRYHHVLFRVVDYLLRATSQDFFAYFGQKYPAYAPFTTPVYSNIGYYLLGLAIENVTGTSYAQYVEQAIINPLNLTHTTIGPPANLNSTFITAGTSWGATSLGFEDR